MQGIESNVGVSGLFECRSECILREGQIRFERTAQIGNTTIPDMNAVGARMLIPIGGDDTALATPRSTATLVIRTAGSESPEIPFVLEVVGL